MVLLLEGHWRGSPPQTFRMKSRQRGRMSRADCLDRRIESPRKMRREVKAYLKQKNTNPVPIKWQFSHHDARIKLHSI